MKAELIPVSEEDVVVDQEISFTLRMLASRKLSVRSADRILRALELLRESEAERFTDNAVLFAMTEGQESPAATWPCGQQNTLTEESISPGGDSRMPMQGAELGELARSIQEVESEGVSAEEIAANGQEKRNSVIIRKHVIAITQTVGLIFAKFCTGSPTFVSISTVSVSMLMVLIYLFSYMLVTCGYEWEVRCVDHG